MAFTGKTPGYPFNAVSLIASPGFGGTSIAARVVINTDPYKVEDGKVVRPTVVREYVDEEGVPQSEVIPDLSYSKSRQYSDAYVDAQTNPKLAQALGLILQGIQLIIDAEEM